MLTIALAQSTEAQSSSAGTITELVGAASIKHKGNVDTANQGDPVSKGDEITTEPGARLTIELADNSKLSLGESTTLVITESVITNGERKKVKLTLRTGRLRSLVEKAAFLVPGSFEVRTTNVLAGVRGTDFEVSYSQETRPSYSECASFTDVGTYEGEVAVSNVLSGAPVPVLAGYQTTVACDAEPELPRPIASAERPSAPIVQAPSEGTVPQYPTIQFGFPIGGSFGIGGGGYRRPSKGGDYGGRRPGTGGEGSTPPSSGYEGSRPAAPVRSYPGTRTGPN